MNLLDLPQDILLKILLYLDDGDLLKIKLVCQSARKLVANEYLWFDKFKRLTTYNPLWSDYSKLSWYKNYKYCSIWSRKPSNKYLEKRSLRSSKTKYLPWLQLVENDLYLSQGKSIQCLNIDQNRKQRRRNAKHHQSPKPWFSTGKDLDDAGRFVVTDDHAFAGTLSGRLCCWRRNFDENSLSDYYYNENNNIIVEPTCSVSAHFSDLHAVAVCGRNIVISGSKDEHVKVWKLKDDATVKEEQQFNLLEELYLKDRIWCLDVEQDEKLLAIGSAACKNDCAPLTVVDIYRSSIVSKLGIPARRGAGVSDAKFRDNNTLFGCGYDSLIRLYDVRTNKCEWYWEEIYNSNIFCLATDNNNAVIIGTSRYGLVWFLDLRYGKRSIRKQLYTTSRNSPVYSLAANMKSIYVSLDSELNEISIK